MGVFQDDDVYNNSLRLPINIPIRYRNGVENTLVHLGDAASFLSLVGESRESHPELWRAAVDAVALANCDPTPTQARKASLAVYNFAEVASLLAVIRIKVTETELIARLIAETSRIIGWDVQATIGAAVHVRRGNARTPQWDAECGCTSQQILVAFIAASAALKLQYDLI